MKPYREVKRMRVEFLPDPNAEEMRVIVCARERTPEVEALMRRIELPLQIIAYGERGEVLLEPGEIIRVYTEKRRVMLDSVRGSYALRSRLYELEEQLGDAFVRISNAELVNRRCIRAMDFSLAGTIRLSLWGGIETYVSRRYVARIRKAFGG